MKNHDEPNQATLTEAFIVHQNDNDNNNDRNSSDDNNADNINDDENNDNDKNDDIENSGNSYDTDNEKDYNGGIMVIAYTGQIKIQ